MKMTTIGLQDLALDGLIKICGGIKNIYPFPFLTGQWFEAISKNQWKWTYLSKSFLLGNMLELFVTGHS